MKKYRRKRIGKSVAEQIFHLHKGQWEVYQKESNKPAQVFWNKIIDEYTKGQFKERLENGRRIPEFSLKGTLNLFPLRCVCFDNFFS